jgi:uncharacterized protein (UPF0332 family)
MPCQPSQILSVASKLKETGTIEADYRSAVSRAYYACFHEVSITYAQFDIFPNQETQSIHAATVRMVAEHSKKSLPGRTASSEMAKLLERMRRNRVQSDYRIEEEVSNNDANDAIVRAEKIFALCQDFSSKMLSK